jgi:ADP-ribose pyrophosphatase YjhB (NUDIX family)
METKPIIVRVNGVLIEDGRLLLVEQYVSETRHWAHPGGKPEPGETLAQAVIREIKEETGLDVSADSLLYVTDRIDDNNHVVIISFLLSKKGGVIGTGEGPEFKTGKIKSVRMVPFDELESCGFSKEYCDLVMSGFPQKGVYRGNILD